MLAAIVRKPHRYDLSKPALPSQLLHTIKEMGLVSNILTRVYIHATRLSAIRDEAYLLKSNEGYRYCTDELRQSLGYKSTTAAKGVTERYVGGYT